MQAFKSAKREERAAAFGVCASVYRARSERGRIAQNGREVGNYRTVNDLTKNFYKFDKIYLSSSSFDGKFFF